MSIDENVSSARFQDESRTYETAPTPTPRAPPPCSLTHSLILVLKHCFSPHSTVRFSLNIPKD